MKRMSFLVMIIALVVSIPALAAGGQGLSTGLQKLNISAGHWRYRGNTLNTSFGKAGNWTWDEDCGWSANREFMVCSFANNWAGTVIKSLVVDTYNRKDRNYSHYELYNGGNSGAQPFISKMEINGNTRIEYATDIEHGKKVETRITYVFDSPAHVKVKIEISHDDAHWVTVDEGEGVKQR